MQNVRKLDKGYLIKLEQELRLIFWPWITRNPSKPHKQNYNTEPDTSSGVKQKQSNEKEVPTPANENTTPPHGTQLSNQEETLSQEQKINIENVRRIMSSEKLFYLH